MQPSRTRIADVLRLEPPRPGLGVAGWVRTVRDSKQRVFLELNDGSTLANLQIVAEGALAEPARAASTGCALRARGDLVPSPAKGQPVELVASALEIVGPAPDDYPLQKKRHSFEFLRTIAHLRVRSNTFGAVARVRNQLAWSIHQFFQQRGFLWVHTPILTASDCEGAGELFRVTTLAQLPTPSESGGADYGEDFFGLPVHLTVSGQLNAEALALALGDVYTFGPTFRAENSNTSRHAAEFWMIEPEMAWADLDDDVALAEAFVKHCIREALARCPDDLAFFDQRIAPGLRDRLGAVAEADFARITYTEAIERLQASGQTFEFPVYWGANLQAEHERWLTEQAFGRPVFVTDYPRPIKAFYMRRNDDDRTVAAMDLLVPGIGELIGGSQREERTEPLVAAMREHGISPDDYRWYLETRRFGSTPHAGFGLGFERLVMMVTGMENIRDVIHFPRTPRNCLF